MSSKEPTEVETSPDGRYLRFDKKLGHGAYKSVWLGYDTEQGIEVAWNTVTLGRLPERERTRLSSETSILQSLSHANIIEFYDVWDNPAKDEIVFTSEYVSSGTLKEFTRRAKDRVKLKVVKKWCRQILHGLHYLHTRKPPIIHRDLKCDNIFINGSTGDIRIGDLGLSTERADTQLQSVLGTPEFMAPEMYDESYNEMVDIYAFGMVVLELCTNEYPYQECRNPAQIYKKVCAGHEPDVLRRITDERVASFIRLCLAQKDLRPNAEKLLDHPFLKFKSCYVSDRYPVSMEVPEPEEDELDDIDEKPNTVIKKPPPQQTAPGTANANGVAGDANRKTTATVNTLIGPPTVKVERADAEKANIALKLPCGDGRRRVVKFQFDFARDTPEAIAREMCTELKLPQSEYVHIYDSIKESVDRERDGTSAQPPSDTGDERADESEMSDASAARAHPPPPLAREESPPPVNGFPDQGDSSKQASTRPAADAYHRHEVNTVVENPAYTTPSASPSPTEHHKHQSKRPQASQQQSQHQPSASPVERQSKQPVERPPSASDSVSPPPPTYSRHVPSHTSSRPASPRIERLREKLEREKIAELKSKIASLGGDSSKCLEKNELVSLCVSLLIKQANAKQARKSADTQKQTRHHHPATDANKHHQPTSSAPHDQPPPPQKSHDHAHSRSSKHNPPTRQQQQQQQPHFPSPAEPSASAGGVTPDTRRPAAHHTQRKREPMSGEHLLSHAALGQISDMCELHQRELDAQIAEYRKQIEYKRRKNEKKENDLRASLIQEARDRLNNPSKVAMSAASSPGSVSSPVSASSASSRPATRVGVTHSPASAPSQHPAAAAVAKGARSRPPTPTGSTTIEELIEELNLGGGGSVSSRSGLSTPIDSNASTPVGRTRRRSAASRSSSPAPPDTPKRGQQKSSVSPSSKDDVIILPYPNDSTSSNAAAPSGTNSNRPTLRRERSLRRERDMNFEAQAALSGRAAPDRSVVNGHPSNASGTGAMGPPDPKTHRKSKNPKEKKDKFSSRTAKAMKDTMGNGAHKPSKSSTLKAAKPGTASTDSKHLPAAGGAAGGHGHAHHPKSRATIPSKAHGKKKAPHQASTDEQEAQLAEERLLSQLFGKDAGGANGVTNKRVPMSGANGHTGMNGHSAAPASTSSKHHHAPSSSTSGSSASSASSSHSSMGSMLPEQHISHPHNHSHSLPTTSSSPPSPPAVHSNRSNTDASSGHTMNGLTHTHTQGGAGGTGGGGGGMSLNPQRGTDRTKQQQQRPMTTKQRPRGEYRTRDRPKKASMNEMSQLAANASSSSTTTTANASSAES